MWLLALLCALIGLIVAIFQADIFMRPMEWFVLGILFALAQIGPLPFVRRQSQ